MRGLPVFLLCAFASAQELLYQPGEAHLACATERWLVWIPDKDPEAKPKPKFENAEELKRYLEAQAEFASAVFIVQDIEERSRRFRVEAKLKRELGRTGLLPVGALADGTIVTSDHVGHELHLFGKDGRHRHGGCYTGNYDAATFVAAYEDGVVLLTGQTRIRRGLDPQRRRAHLYFVPIIDGGTEHGKAVRMTTGRGLWTMGPVHVARFKEKIALSGFVFSVKSRKRRKLDASADNDILAFDGTTAVGRTSMSGTKRKSIRAVEDRRPYFLARDGIGYWVDRNKEIRACRLDDQAGEVKLLGRVSWPGEFHRRQLYEWCVVTNDHQVRRRATIFWTQNQLVWTDGRAWRKHKLLFTSDFE